MDVAGASAAGRRLSLLRHARPTGLINCDVRGRPGQKGRRASSLRRAAKLTTLTTPTAGAASAESTGGQARSHMRGRKA